MAEYQFITLEKDHRERIATLTLNREDRRNALNDIMQDEIEYRVRLQVSGPDQGFGEGIVDDLMFDVDR